jgi:hypothetical protein
MGRRKTQSAFQVPKEIDIHDLSPKSWTRGQGQIFIISLINGKEFVSEKEALDEKK